MQVRMNNFEREVHALNPELFSVVERVIESGHFVLGNEVANFERLWAATCGTEFAVGVANGLDAIELALRCAGVGPGDEVITTSLTALATVIAISKTGATPVVGDIDPETGLLDIDSARRCLSPRTRAVVLVHLFGRLAEMSDWCDFSEQAGVLLIEDCAQSHLARDESGVAGSFGFAGAYSFYPTKNLGAYGDGGAVVTNSGTVSERLKSLRNYGQRNRYEHEEIGTNSRLDELQAAILNLKLSHLEKNTDRRRVVADFYDQELDDSRVLTLTKARIPESHVHHLYVVKTERRSELMHFLKEAGVESLIHYPIPVNGQKPFAQVRTDPMGVRNAEEFSLSCISLPCNPYLLDEELEFVVRTVNAFR